MESRAAVRKTVSSPVCRVPEGNVVRSFVAQFVGRSKSISKERVFKLSTTTTAVTVASKTVSSGQQRSSPTATRAPQLILHCVINPSQSKIPLFSTNFWSPRFLLHLAVPRVERPPFWRRPTVRVLEPPLKISRKSPATIKTRPSRPRQVEG